MPTLTKQREINSIKNKLTKMDYLMGKRKHPPKNSMTIIGIRGQSVHKMKKFEP